LRAVARGARIVVSAALAASGKRTLKKAGDASCTILWMFMLHGGRYRAMWRGGAAIRINLK